MQITSDKLNRVIPRQCHGSISSLAFCEEISLNAPSTLSLQKMGQLPFADIVDQHQTSQNVQSDL